MIDDIQDHSSGTSHTRDGSGRRLNGPVRPGLASILFASLFVLATATGGSSIADALGQPIVRFSALILLAIGIMVGLEFDFRRYHVILWLFLAMLLLVAIQLVPLPPMLWRSLPGRGAFDLSALLPEAASVWRPAAIVPVAAWNALFALLVPLSAFLLIGAVPRGQLALGVPLLASMVTISSVVAALQFAGGAFDNPLINESVGFASGLFANRNHQALFLAIGIMAVAQWGATRPFLHIRVMAAAVLTGWFVLMILATGSRAGLVLGLVALAGGCTLVIGALRRARVRIGLRALLIAGGLSAVALAGAIATSLYAGRSESLNRLNDAAIGDDMRVRAMPVVIKILRNYLPTGAGQGSFVALFKVEEPEALLKPTFFNHAHNDFFELVIEAGIPGVLLLFLCLAWLVLRAWEAWRQSPGEEVQRARLGSLVFLLVLMASVVDYPARTPIIMVTLVLAAAWLSIDPRLLYPLTGDPYRAGRPGERWRGRSGS